MESLGFGSPGASDHIRALCDDLCCKTREESGIATGLTLIHVECVAGSPAEINKVALQGFHKALGHVIGAHPELRPIATLVEHAGFVPPLDGPGSTKLRQCWSENHAASFDHLVGAGEQRRRQFEA